MKASDLFGTTNTNEIFCWMLYFSSFQFLLVLIGILTPTIYLNEPTASICSSTRTCCPPTEPLWFLLSIWKKTHFKSSKIKLNVFNWLQNRPTCGARRSTTPQKGWQPPPAPTVTTKGCLWFGNRRLSAVGQTQRSLPYKALLYQPL